MLQKFAFALKSKTIELFAEEEDDDDHELTLDLDPAADELITGQRVVVLKPDAPTPLPLLPSLLAALSSFRAAYLHLQSAHSPFDADALRAADRAAVSHLRRLSLLKHPSSNLTALLESQVQDNQNLLRTFDTVINRLQAEIDRKDSAAAALKQTLITLNAANARLSRRLDRASSSPDDRVETLLSVSVFDGVLKDACRAAHRFTRVLIELMTSSGWDLNSAAEAIHPGVVYAKPGHCRYAILSYITLRMFQGFETNDFSCEESERTRADSLRQFIEHSSVDPLELMSREPNCTFSVFCKKKYDNLVSLGTECSLLGDLDCLLESTSAVYEPFIGMASAVWTLHKLAWAYNPVVGIFQVGRGKEFSMVYMERVTKSDASRRVGFTVIPGFRVGKTVIQCRVYVEGL